MEQEIREITLPGGETVLARVRVLDDDEVPGGAEEFPYDDVGTRDQLIARAQQLNEVISGVGSAVLDAARQARPDEVSVTFGVELAVKSGRALAAVLADGEAKAAVSVTLTWHRDEPAPPDGTGGAPDGGGAGTAATAGTGTGTGTDTGGGAAG
ncbi:CU044_2847 family protein [Streptomyces albus subsp. chlorinus]|uniref:CU044_2847 family protein n=1 Tax=Streptomyces albus TaxID=1888 RepID=UPI001FAD3E40|nr:CU044_2847 family protein [Streptomyces albus]